MNSSQDKIKQSRDPLTPIKERIVATGEAAVALETHQEIDFSSLQGIGLSLKAGWYASAVLYGVGGLLSLALYAFTNTVPEVVAWLAVVAIVFSLACMVGVRLIPFASWGPYVRIGLGIAIIVFGGFSIGQVAGAMISIALFPLLSVAYLYQPTISIPYTAVTVSATVPILSVLHLPTAFVIVASSGMTMLAAAAIYSQHHLRKIARINHELAVADPLTGVANVRRLHSRLREEVLSANRDGHRFALYAIDLDDFKQVNDRFSHTVGDELLRAVATAIGKELEPGDLVARRGGDEFAVLAMASTNRDLSDLSERVRNAIHTARMTVCPDVNPHGSAGYAVYRTGESLDELAQRADDALHQAKLAAHPERREQSAKLLSLDSYRSERSRAKTDGDAAAKRKQRGLGQADFLVAGKGDELKYELEMARWARRSLGTATAWDHAATMNMVIGILLALLAATGVMTELRTTVGIGAIAGLLAAVPVFVYAAHRESRLRALLVANAINVALIATICISVPDTAWELVDLLLLPVVFAFFFFKAKQALPFFVVCMGLFIALLFVSDYPYIAIRSIQAVTIISMAMGLLVKARKMTHGFTERAVDISVVDPLTELTNLRGLRQRVADEIVRCTVTGSKLVLLAIDLDDFKAVNDTYSHAKGDEVLKATGQAIKNSVRADELAARRGGDEFAAVCICDREDEVISLVLRLADAIDTVRAAICPDLMSTASIGYVTLQPGEDIDSFLGRADEELHGAKIASHASRSAAAPGA